MPRLFLGTRGFFLMKKNILFILILFSSVSALAQRYSIAPNMLEYDEKKWHFGFTLGPDFQNMKIINNSENLISLIPSGDLPSAPLITGNTISEVKYYSEIAEVNSPGFHVGIIASKRLGTYLNLRFIPSLSLGGKDIKSQQYLSETGVKDTTYTGNNTISTNIKSTYISVPVLLKYKAVRINNMRPYAVAGAAFKYDLATSFDNPITLKRIDTSLEFGLGSDFYLETFRFGIELRFGIGLFNMLADRPAGDTVDDNYLSSSIDKIRAKTFTIAFNFE